MIKLLLIDNQVIFREGLKRVVEDWDGFLVTGCASLCEEALAECAISKPDIALIETTLPDFDGGLAIGRIKASSPATRVIVLTSSLSRDFLLGSIFAGAQGFLMKDMSVQLLRSCLESAMRGNSPLAGNAAALCLDEMRRSCDSQATRDPQDGLIGSSSCGDNIDQMGLTQREVEILALLAEGLSNQMIAERLFISEKTVKKHLNNLFAKLDVANRSQAAIWAIRAGLS